MLALVVNSEVMISSHMLASLSQRRACGRRELPLLVYASRPKER
jgi:hypothetical protein